MSLQHTRELLQSSLDTPGSEVTEEPLGAQRGLCPIRRPMRHRGAHCCTAHARSPGTRRSTRITMYPSTAPGALLARNAAMMNHNAAW